MQLSKAAVSALSCDERLMGSVGARIDRTRGQDTTGGISGNEQANQRMRLMRACCVWTAHFLCWAGGRRCILENMDDGGVHGTAGCGGCRAWSALTLRVRWQRRWRSPDSSTLRSWWTEMAELTSRWTRRWNTRPARSNVTYHGTAVRHCFREVLICST